MEMKKEAIAVAKRRKKSAMPAQNDDGSTIHEPPHRGLGELNKDYQPNMLAEALYKAAHAVSESFDGMSEDSEVPSSGTEEMIRSNEPQGLTDMAKAALEAKKKKRKFE